MALCPTRYFMAQYARKFLALKFNIHVILNTQLSSLGHLDEDIFLSMVDAGDLVSAQRQEPRRFCR